MFPASSPIIADMFCSELVEIEVTQVTIAPAFSVILVLTTPT